jgi:hypothetical protein
MTEYIEPTDAKETKDPERIRSEFHRQVRWVLVAITGPIFLMAILIVIQFYGFGVVDTWYILPLLVVSLIGGLIGGALLTCPCCGIRQPFGTSFRSDNKCRKCRAVLF